MVTGLVLALASCTTEEQQQEKKRTYNDLLEEVREKRAKIKEQYLAADSLARDSVVKAARSYVFSTITTKQFSYWFNTPWDFNGTTRIPGQGKIACGYFVTTVLYDAGFDLPRTKWAQLASEAIIKKLSSDIRRFHNKPVKDVASHLAAKPDGLYIVGLDTHVGFIYKSGKTMRFVHSNYYEPEKGVMAQELDCYNPLRDSRYRVLGRILDDAMMKAWILDERMGE